MSSLSARHSLSARRQSGAALLVALVLLVAVTLLGVSAMQGTIMQERMSANQRDVEEAFNAAEIALRRGEGALMSSPFDFVGNDALANPDAIEPPWPANTVPLDDLQTSLNAAQPGADRYVLPPVYHAAKRGDICSEDDDLTGGSMQCDEIFSVTARGTGRTETTFVVLQSAIRVPE